jgi:hypothetical protein
MPNWSAVQKTLYLEDWQIHCTTSIQWTCSCRRTFSLPQAYTYHKCSCHKMKKWLTVALDKAKDIWQAKGQKGCGQTSSNWGANGYCKCGPNHGHGKVLSDAVFAMCNNYWIIRTQLTLHLWRLMDWSSWSQIAEVTENTTKYPDTTEIYSQTLQWHFHHHHNPCHPLSQNWSPYNP